MVKPQFATKKVELTKTYGKFLLTPLPSGFGQSLGNALRRVLLSSINGAAVTYVKINDVVHPFTTMEGVKESGLDIIINLKALRFKVVGDGPFTMNLTLKGKGIVLASEFKGDVEIVNKDQHIAELTSPKAKLEIALTIERGLGFSPSEEKEQKTFGVLAVDSVFSPVTKVNYRVEDERVGRKTNYDKLALEVWTDGTVSPEKALRQSAEILGEYFSYVLSGKDEEHAKEEHSEQTTTEGKEVDDKVYEIIIDELDLPTRAINALLREQIETVGDLVGRGKNSLVVLKGVGRKSITLIETELSKLGIKLEEE